MPIYVIERNFAEPLNLTKADVDGMQLINDEEGVRWLTSFVRSDRRKSYCVCEAPDVDALRAQARRAGIPADVIVEVDQVRPEAFAAS